MLSIDISNLGQLKNTEDENSAGEKKNGTSLNNIAKRLNIMFRDNASFRLFEENGWVHAVINIQYDIVKNEKKVFLAEKNFEKVVVR